MHGNVQEWCQDWYDQDYYAISPTDDPKGPAAGSSRVNRGGYWHNIANACRAAKRDSSPRAFRHESLGFRIARTLLQ
jgi:formylglycine-generating enzyme required for sulfatase activity